MAANEHEPTDDDELASAPESGQVPGGRDNPWDDDTPSPTHLWPDERHGAPKDEL
jgi:hypothetical protein